MAMHGLAGARIGARAGALALEPCSRDERIARPQTIPRLTVETVATRAAGGPPDDHFVAGCDLRHSGSDTFHDSRTLVAKHTWERHRQIPRARDGIRVAHTGCHDAHKYLASAGLVQVEVLHLKRRILRLDDQCPDSHSWTSWSPYRYSNIAHATISAFGRRPIAIGRTMFA
jgi:hypothetical protein